MPKKYFFSINLLIKNDSHLEKSIASVISDTDFFINNVQLLLINSAGSDFTHEICRKYSSMYPENIFFVDSVGKGTADCYNDARPLCSGQYISYIDNYGEYSKNAFSMLYEVIKNAKIPIVCVQPLISVPGESVRPYVSDIKQGLVKLRDTPDRFILMLGCYFFNKKVVKDILFDRELKIHGDVKFITDTLLKTYSYIFLEKIQYTSSSACETEFFRYEPQYSRNFYTKSINEFIIPMLKNYIGSVLVESVMMYLINIKFSLNSDDKYKNVKSGNSVTDFIETAAEALRYIDDAIILSKRLCRFSGLDDEVPFRFLRLKYNNKTLKPDITVASQNETVDCSYYDMNNHLYKLQISGDFVASVNNAVVERSKEVTAEITAINYDKTGLYVDAYMNGCACFDDKDFSVYAVVNKKRSDVISSNVYTLKKFFDISFLSKRSFKLFIPISKGKEIDNIFIVMKLDKLSFRVNLEFNGIFSRLSGKLKNSYWCFNDRVMTYNEKTRSLTVRRATDSLIAIYENKFLGEAGKYLSMSELLYYRQLRKSVRRVLSDTQRHKSIMFYDEMGINYNGNLLFRYFSKFKRTDTIDVYFSAQRDSEEQAFLIDSGYEGVLETGSKKAKATAMVSDLIVATDCDVYESLAFTKRDIIYLKDLFNAKVISIKNFFMTYDTAQFDNRLRDNTQMIFCSSENEKEQLLKKVYDYDETMIKITGYPMLDAVSNKKEKIILIAPGDRKLFCIYENSSYYRFADSRFFKTYNSVLTDTEFLKELKKLGYKIALLMPQAIEKYIKMFSADGDTVQLYNYTEQNETGLISRAAVLVTDYSELQYRFAYLNKPVVYYQSQALPIQQEFKEQRFTRSIFGEVIYDRERLTEYLLKNAKKDFPQPIRYERRCNEFFKHIDGDNCGRIMNTVIDSFFPGS